jgi:hypothetical protein
VTAAMRSYVVFFLAGMIEEFISDFSLQITLLSYLKAKTVGNIEVISQILTFL